MLLFFGWFALHLNFLGWALLLLPAAYVIGGYESAREGLTTLFKEKELDVDLLMIVAALGAAIVLCQAHQRADAAFRSLHGVAFQRPTYSKDEN